METRILSIINYIRQGNSLNTISEIHYSDNLRIDYSFTSFDLAELTVRIQDEFDIDIFEDGLVLTVGEIFEKLKRK